MTGFSADLFHRGSLWGLTGRDCAIRGAFSSTIHSAHVLPFQCWRAWRFEEEEGGDRVAVDGTLQRAVPDPTRVCLYCPLLTMFFRLSSLSVYADSPWGGFGACEQWPRWEVRATWAAVSSSSLGDSSASVAIWDHTQPTMWCSGVGDTTTPFPRWHCRTLQNLGKVEGDQDAGPRAAFSCGRVPCWSSMNIARFSFAPVVMRTGLAALPVLTFSSPKLRVPAWLCSGFTFPFMARPCTSEVVACSDLPLCPRLAALCRFWVGTKAASYTWSSQMDAGREGSVSRRCKPFLVLTCTFLSPVWQPGGQGEPEYEPERLNSHFAVKHEISSQGKLQ